MILNTFIPLMAGDALTPPRFWGRYYALSQHEYEMLKEKGWVIDNSSNAITKEDIENDRKNIKSS